MLILLIVAFLLVAMAEVPRMAARGQTGELRTFWVLLVIGFVLSLAVARQWPIVPALM